MPITSFGRHGDRNAAINNDVMVSEKSAVMNVNINKQFKGGGARELSKGMEECISISMTTLGANGHSNADTEKRMTDTESTLREETELVRGINVCGSFLDHHVTDVKKCHVAVESSISMGKGFSITMTTLGANGDSGVSDVIIFLSFCSFCFADVVLPRCGRSAVWGWVRSMLSVDIAPVGGHGDMNAGNGREIILLFNIPEAPYGMPGDVGQVSFDARIFNIILVCLVEDSAAFTTACGGALWSRWRNVRRFSDYTRTIIMTQGAGRRIR